MGYPFSRAVELKMPKRKPSKKAHNRNRNSPSATSKVNSVHSFSKLTSSSRQSNSHSSLAAILRLRTYQNGHRSRLIRNPSRNTHSSLRNQVATYASSHPSQYSYYTLDTDQQETDLSSRTSLSHKRVLVVEDVGNKMGGALSKNRKPQGGCDWAYLLEKESINFDDIECLQAHFANNEASQAKAKKFVMAWRAGLSYPKTKKDKVLRDIPIAATSHCKTGINRCTRCYRRHLKRRLHSSDENLLADLVHKESLEKFIEETEQFHATSSIMIKEDLKRKQLYDSVHHADSADKIDKDKENKSMQLSDDDMQLTIQFNVPPPVHIDYIPERNLFEKDMQKMADLGLLKKKSGEIRQPFSMAKAPHKPVLVVKKH